MRKGVLVTGGSRGIGSGIARCMARDGYDVAFTYRGAHKEAQALCRELEGYGARAFCRQANLEKVEDCRETVAWAAQALGQLDAAVCNAGVTLTYPFQDFPLEQMQTLMDLNLLGYLLTAQAAAKVMISAGRPGAIVMITSVRATRAFPEDAVYGGIKAALCRAAEGMALDLARYGIRVNTVAPGYIQTRDTPEVQAFSEGFGARIPLGRAGQPSDIGNAVRFLCSEKASYITGTTLRVDGGLILPGMPEVPFGPGWGNPDYPPDDEILDYRFPGE